MFYTFDCHFILLESPNTWFLIRWGSPNPHALNIDVSCTKDAKPNEKVTWSKAVVLVPVVVLQPSWCCVMKDMIYIYQHGSCITHSHYWCCLYYNIVHNIVKLWYRQSRFIKFLFCFRFWGPKGTTRECEKLLPFNLYI